MPVGARVQIMELCHDSPAGGHFRTEKTLDFVTQNYYWLDLRSCIHDYTYGCDTCAQIKPLRQKPNGELKSLEALTRPWTDITVDIIPELPLSFSTAETESAQGYNAILTVVDRFSKITHLIPTQTTMDTVQFTHIIIQDICRLHSPPASIVSDQAKIFISSFWKTLASAMGIKTKLTTAFHPQCDGQTKRHNHTAEQYLRGYVNWEQTNWVDLLPLTEWAYNNSKNATTGYTPFFACYGFEPWPWQHVDLDMDSQSVGATEKAEQMDILHQTLPDPS